MTQTLPELVKKTLNRLINAGFEAHVVGGATRDLLTNKEATDWDFTTNATPEQILPLFPSSYYHNVFGTVAVPTKEGIFEITTYRTEREYTDNRHPEVVEWGKTIEEDLARRDFTINAMAIDAKGTITDPYNGQDDLKKQLIRAVREPDERFKEDALRLLRAIRIATQLKFTLEDKTFEAIKNNAQLINNIAKERVRDEIVKILSSDFPADGFLLLLNAGLLEHVLPELTKGVGVAQSHHHKYDVWHHNLYSLKYCPSTDPIVRFATIMHDSAKPIVKRGTGEEATFYNHEVVGESIVRNVMTRLRFSKKEIERATNLVRWHMFTVDEHITDAAVRRFIRRVGVENVTDIIHLRIGDRLGGGCLEATSWRLRRFMERVEEVQKTPLSVKDLKIDGTDVMKLLHLEPGPKVGIILNALFDEVLEDASKNNKEYLTQRVKQLSQ